jgi:hypothetical protein
VSAAVTGAAARQRPPGTWRRAEWRAGLRIAAQLVLSVVTVDSLLQRGCAKLGVSSHMNPLWSRVPSLCSPTSLPPRPATISPMNPGRRVGTSPLAGPMGSRRASEMSSGYLGGHQGAGPTTVPKRAGPRSASTETEEQKMNWFLLNMPLAAAFFGAWVGIPMWLVLKHPDQGPGPLANQVTRHHQVPLAEPHPTLAA